MDKNRSKKQIFQQKREFMQKGQVTVLRSTVGGFLSLGLFTIEEKKILQEIYKNIIILHTQYDCNTIKIKEQKRGKL